MMKEIGVFICNYNKADMVIKCVQAIRDQTYKELDIFVIDNASEDSSVERLIQAYQDEITILRNEKNSGGSGGFGRAIRTALELGYKYFMLVDNDAFLDREAIGHLHSYLEEHADVGICGAETLYLHQPDKIQDLGGKLDNERYWWSGVIGGLTELPGNIVLECDYVASCAVMARASAVREFGGFPEENFIYWDDVEWCTKCWKAGYKVVVNGNAKALHDMSQATSQNMFQRYYASRNHYKFFTKYLPEDKLEVFFEYITEEFFSQNYGAIYKKKYGTVFTMWNALDDFMHGVMGKAAEGQIVPYSEGEDRLAEYVKGYKKILIYMPVHTQKDYDILNRVLRYLMKHNEKAEVLVTFTLEDRVQENFDIVLQLCEHAIKIKEDILPRVYIDRWMNAILDEKDYWYFSNYDKALENFRKLYWPLFKERMRELR